MSTKLKLATTVIVHTGVDMTKMMAEDYAEKSLHFIDLSDVNNSLRVFRRLTFKIIPGFWVKYIFSEVNKLGVLNVILFDSILTNHLCRYVKKYVPNSKVRFWLWNSIDKKKIEYIKRHSDFVYSFDPKQCNENNLQYINQFLPYNKDILECSNIPIYNASVSFVGSDKGRLLKLLSLAEFFEKKGCYIDFHIKTKSKLSMGNISLIKNDISYIKILDIYKNSSVILDLNKRGQVGLSLRPVEALFLKKKLITNNVDIVNYSFYRKANIFILNRDSEDDLLSFITTPFECLTYSVLNEYNFEYWLGKMLNDVDVI